MEEVPDDFEAALEPPTLVREKTVKKGRPKKEAKKKEEPPAPNTPEEEKPPVEEEPEVKVEKPAKEKPVKEKTVAKPVQAKPPKKEKPLAPPKNLLKKLPDTPEWVDPRPRSFYEELAMARQAQALQRQNAMMAPYMAMFEQRRNAAY